MTLPDIDEDVSKQLSKYSPFLQTLLVNRGIVNSSEADRYLNPDYDFDLSDPLSMNDMQKAIDRIGLAIQQGEKIMIYSDYDADGIPGAVVLHDFFKKIGYENFEVYIPHRHDEGFGLHIDAIRKFPKDVKLLITIDLGINAIDAVSVANDLGIDVIITDHHIPETELPDAFAIVNPKLGNYNDPMLCGCGTIFRVVQAMVNSGKYDIPTGWDKWLLDMVGMATLSDMVPLRNENRVLASYGLKVLQKSRRPGLQKLFYLTKVKQNTVTEDDLTFMITPRINAASRMSEPRDAFDVLATKNPGLAGASAEHLSKLNDNRKLETARIMKSAKAKLSEREIKDVIVIGDPKWSSGIRSIISTKVAEEYNRPTFVWNREGEIIRGSCRGDGTVHMLDMMKRVETIIQCGGHAGAGGFSIAVENIHTLEQELIRVLPESQRLDKEPMLVDADLILDDIKGENWDSIEQCAPFGVGNPKPLFRFSDIEVKSSREFGKGKEHLELQFANSEGKTVKAIQFFKKRADYDMPLRSGSKINMLAHFELSRWNGSEELRLRIVDIIDG